MNPEKKTLDGSRIASEIRDEVAAEVAVLLARGVTPRLDAVLVARTPRPRSMWLQRRKLWRL